jgi:predicted molibdopterin-dependent oxidoreductase YjgC
MIKTSNTIVIDLNGKSYEVESGLTILQAAERSGVYIPTLCAHKNLSPFGACRMCIVEVGGMKGFPTACTTPVQEGMIVRTETDKVREMRLEVLRLTLSQHTCGCLVCEENEQCKQHSGTVRKAGVTTGCRTCPNDGGCDLQDVVERIGLKDIAYPVYYRDLPVEKYDPFYDRDYNLCILCGRCVRICQDVRGVGTLAFQQRGSRTVIGPAFGQTHLEAGCEFCGACVSVCPTGALSEKVRKWDGKPDREEITTCPLCGLGCQVKLLVKDERIIGSLPADDSVVNDGQLCVKGRFCFAEMVNHCRRLAKPYVIRDTAKIDVGWDEAIERAAKKLSSCVPERFAMLVSPDCTNEDLYVAQKFVRVAMRSNNIDTSARMFYGAGFHAYLDLMKSSAPLSDIRKASVILCIGLDTRFGRSVVGVELRKAAERGAKLITVHPFGHSLTLTADEWLQPAPCADHELLETLLGATIPARGARGRSISKGKENGLSAAARLLGEAAVPLILIGPDILHYSDSPKILETVGRLVRAVGADVLTLPAQCNLFGSILMGAYPELLPGGFASSNKMRAAELERVWGAGLPDLTPRWTAESLSSGGRVDVLYLIGEVPTIHPSAADVVIFQNIFPPESICDVDLILPSAAFSETDGTFLSGEGRLQRVKKAVEPPGEALPDWEILCRVARKMGVKGFEFADVRQVHEEISHLVKGFGEFDALDRETVSLTYEGEMDAAHDLEGIASRGAGDLARITSGTPGNPTAASVDNTSKKPADTYPFVLTAAVDEHIYKGFPISDWVAGAREIFAAGSVAVNPENAAKAHIREGDEVVVNSTAFEKKWRARITADQPEGSLHVTLRPKERLGPNPHHVNMRKSDV